MPSRPADLPLPRHRWILRCLPAMLALYLISIATTASGQGGPRLVGEWHTVANGDDVAAIAKDGDELWVGTGSGGVAKWSSDGRLLRRYLAPQDGLPCNDVRDVIHWRGVWWFATCRGLVAYDAGRDRMEVADVVLPSNSITALAADHEGRLWAATEPVWNPGIELEGKPEPGGWTGGGVALTQDGSEWILPGSVDQWPSRNPRDLIAWSGGMWVAARPHLEWRPPSSGSGGDTQPGAWIPRGGGVGRYAAEAWTRFNSDADSSLSDSAVAVAATSEALWVGTEGKGLFAFDGGRWTNYRDCGDPFRCLNDNYVSALAVAPDGAIFIGTTLFNGRGTGLSLLDSRGTPADPADDAWHHIGQPEGLPGELVAEIVPASDAGVWLGIADVDAAGRRMGHGLTHLLNDRQSIVVHSMLGQGMGVPADNVVTSLLKDSRTGRLWVGTDRGGLSVREPDGAWRTFTRESTGGGLGSDSVSDIAITDDGAVWVGTRQTTYDSDRHRWVDGGLSRFDGTSWRRLTTADGLPSDHISALAVDDQGKLWVGTGATMFGSKEHHYRGWGVAVVDAASIRWERTFAFPDITSNNVTDIEVRGKEVWVATAYFFYVDPRPGGAQLNVGGGISVLDQASGQWRKLDDEDGLTPAVEPRFPGTGNLLDFRALHVDAGGRAWAGGAAYPNGEYIEDRAMDGVVDILDDDVEHIRFDRSGPVTDIVEDIAGNVWMATLGDGLHIRSGDEWLHQGTTQGRLPSDDMTAISIDGSDVWIGTLGGGLAELRPLPTAVPTDETLPTATPGVVVRLDEQIFLPRALRQRVIEVQPLPQPIAVTR